MAILIGVDEAGYGPNLGPLTICGSAWRVADVDSCDLYPLLASAVSRRPVLDRLAIADSKQLYRPGSGLGHLERGVLAALTVRGEPAACVTSWSTLLAALSATDAAAMSQLPWHVDFDPALPLDCAPDALPAEAERLAEACRSTGTSLLDLRARLVFPAELNRLVGVHGTKGGVLSYETLALVRTMIDSLPKDAVGDVESIEVVCDKHGGRNHYAGVIQHHFPEGWTAPQIEGRSSSRYQTETPHGRMQIEFRARGEELLPTALGSMAAKYVRELAMRAFNLFWQERIPGLRPTAGYPLDAKRFRIEIAPLQKKLKIADRILWRER